MKYEDKFTEVTYWELDYSDFEQIVKEVYGIKEYYFVADIECGNDSEHTFTTDLTYRDDFEDDEIEEFITTGSYSNMAGNLIKDLARKELIPKGNILISVSW